MPEAAFACPKCKTAISLDPGAAELAVSCPGCASGLEAFLFPAFYRPPEIASTGVPLIDVSEASCFYHPQKQAARVCDGCGRLICGLCAVDMGKEHLCPACISSGRKKARLAPLANGRTRFDNVALSLAVASLFMSFFSVILSPAAIFMAVRYWNSPGGLQGRGLVRKSLAIGIALFSLVFWITVFGFTFFWHKKS